MKGIEEYCKKCKWFTRETVCKAYPSGIPEPIVKGELVHDTPWLQSDRPFVFEAKKDEPVYKPSDNKTDFFSKNRK